MAVVADVAWHAEAYGGAVWSGVASGGLLVKRERELALQCVALTGRVGAGSRKF